MKINVEGKDLECIIITDEGFIEFCSQAKLFNPQMVIIDKIHSRPKSLKNTNPEDIIKKAAQSYIKTLPEMRVEMLDGLIFYNLRRIETSIPKDDNDDWINARTQYHAIIQGYGPHS